MNKFQPAVKYGFYLGIFSIIFHIVPYVIDSDIFFNKGYSVFKMVLFWAALPIVFMLLGTKAINVNKEYFSYGKAFKSAFYVGFIAVAILLTYESIITFVDPELGEWVYDTAIEKQTVALEDANAPDSQIEQTVKGMEMARPYFSGIGGVIITNVALLLFYLILALIIGAIQKDKKEEDLLT